MSSPARGGSATAVPTPSTAATPTEELLFEPTGDLWKDYAAYCEIDKRPERDELVDAIKVYDPAVGPSGMLTMSDEKEKERERTEKEKEAAKTAPVKSDGKADKADKSSSVVAPPPPPKTVTSVVVRNLDCCLNKRDLTPLTSAMPHCPTLVSVHLTGCGVTEQSYKLLCEAAYKSPSLTSLSVDFNPNGLFKDPTVGRKEKTDIVLYPAHFRGAHMRLSDPDKDLEKKDMKSSKDAGKKGKGATSSAAAQQAAAQAAQQQAEEQAGLALTEKQPVPLPSGWHGMLFSGIQQLSLRGNGITCAQAEQLATGLANNIDMISLNLWGNSIGTQGGCALMKVLASNKRLTALDLGHNQLTDSVLLAFGEALMSQDVTIEDAMKLRTRAVKALPTTLPSTGSSAATAITSASGGHIGSPNGGSQLSSVAAAAAQQASQSQGLGPCGYPLPGMEVPVYPMFIELFGVLPTDEMKAQVLGGAAGAVPAKKKPETKGKKTADLPTERPKAEFDRDCVRIDEHTLRVPGNTTLWGISFAQNAAITGDGIRALSAALKTREPNFEELHGNPPDDLSFAPYVSSSIALEKVDVSRTRCDDAIRDELRDALKSLEQYRAQHTAV